MMDQISLARLAQLHPKLQGLINSTDLALSLEGIQIRIMQGLRTMADQAAIYAEGRSAPGKIVTNAKPGYSYHQYGVAADLVPGLRNVADWEPNWDEKSADFATMIRIGIGLGLVSGSEWVHMPDAPHFQLAGLPVTPTDQMRAVLEEKGIEEFWKEFVV